MKMAENEGKSEEKQNRTNTQLSPNRPKVSYRILVVNWKKRSLLYWAYIFFNYFLKKKILKENMILSSN